MKRRVVDNMDLVNQLERDVRELKAAQRVAGHNLVGYYTSQTGTYDYTFNLGASGTHSFTITFTHSKSKFGSIQQLSLFYGLNDPNVDTAPYPAWANGPPVYYYIQKLPPTATQNQWLVHVVNNGGLTWDVYFKAYFKGTDTGVFTYT